MKKISFIFIIIIPGFIYSQTTVVDTDGNVYKTVKIGKQEWFAENLKVTKYRNGEPIKLITDSVAWASYNTGAYCNYRNDSTIAAIYGRLYNWYVVVDSRNVCPSGWHIPGDEEWAELGKFLGGNDIAGGKMKLKDSTIWRAPNLGATNESRFSALPAGRQYHNSFYFLHQYTNIWSSAQCEYDSNLVWCRYMTYNSAVLSRFTYNKHYGLSVRCIKD